MRKFGFEEKQRARVAASRIDDRPLENTRAKPQIWIVYLRACYFTDDSYHLGLLQTLTGNVGLPPVSHVISCRADQHQSKKEIWLIFDYKSTVKPTIFFEDAVEEAICFGWIDSQQNRMDDERFIRRFSPRRQQSSWSKYNKMRTLKMLRERKFTEAGMAVLSADVIAICVNPQLCIHEALAFWESVHKKPSCKPKVCRTPASILAPRLLICSL